MKGVPGVAAYYFQEKGSIYTFIRGDNDRLYVCFWNAEVSKWEWQDLGMPPNARLNSSPVVAAPYLPSVSRIHAFVLGNDGHLYERYWNGSKWLAWADLGHPNVATLNFSPDVVALPSAVRSILHVFCLAADQNNSFLFRYFPVFNPWVFQGTTLTAADVVSEPGSAVMRNSIYTYVVGNDGHLHVVHNEAVSNTQVNPSWHVLKAPTTGILSRNRPAITVFPPVGAGRLFSFICSNEGQLWANIWGGLEDRSTESWLDLGMPEGTGVKNAADVVNFRFGNKDFLYVFVQGANNHLYVFRWDGSNDRLWADLGRPHTGGQDVQATAQSGNTLVSSPPGAVPFRFVEPHRATNRMYAFVYGADNHLHVCYWNGVENWFWTDLGTYPLPPDPIKGDYTLAGVQLSNRRADISLLISKLKKIGANHFMHLIVNREHANWPFGWEDFQLMAPQFQLNGLSLWAYLTPPSEKVPPAFTIPEPYGFDFLRWAEEIARIARDCSTVQGMVIDDFNHNTNLFTVSYVSQILSVARAIHPGFQFFVTSYFGRTNIFQEHVARGLVDGLVFAYFYDHQNHEETSTLRPQIEELRNWLDTNSPGKRIKLLVMIYASKHSNAPADPTPQHVQHCLEIVREASREGLADGAVTYVLPKGDQNFLDAVRQIYEPWRP